MANDALENLANESRIFEPTKEFADNANAKIDMYEEAKKDRIKFWEKQALRLHWDKPWSKALDWSNAPFAKWFIGGKLNASYNCLDRHVLEGRGDRVAIYFEGEPGDSRAITYSQMKKKRTTMLPNIYQTTHDNEDVDTFETIQKKNNDSNEEIFKIYYSRCSYTARNRIFRR